MERLQYRDHFGRRIRVGSVVVFAKTGKDENSLKKNTILLSGIVVALKNKDGNASVKIIDPATNHISHIRRLSNIAVLSDDGKDFQNRLPKYLEYADEQNLREKDLE